MSTPTESSRDELRRLRERAYGPAADIHDDPVALARLHELENAALSPTAPESGPDSPPDETIAADVSDDALSQVGAFPSFAEPDGADPVGADDPTPSPSDVREPVTDATAPRPWWRRRIPVLWAGSVVVALLLGVGLTLGVQAVEAGKVAVLSEDPEGEWPAQQLGPVAEEFSRFEDFYGLSIAARSVGSAWADAAIPCIWLYRDDDATLGIASSGCSAGSFPAQASFIVSAGSPVELREHFPVGTALLFVHEGSHVHVYAQAPDVVRPTP